MHGECFRHRGFVCLSRSDSHRHVQSPLLCRQLHGHDSDRGGAGCPAAIAIPVEQRPAGKLTHRPVRRHLHGHHHRRIKLQRGGFFPADGHHQDPAQHERHRGDRIPVPRRHGFRDGHRRIAPLYLHLANGRYHGHDRQPGARLVLRDGPRLCGLLRFRLGIGRHFSLPDATAFLFSCRPHLSGPL